MRRLDFARFARIVAPLILLAVALGCGDEQLPQPKATFAALTDVSDATPPVETLTLPAALEADRTLSAGDYRGVVLVGGKSGLYKQSGQSSFEQVDGDPVVAITHDPGAGSRAEKVIIARARRFETFDGTLLLSPLYAYLGGAGDVTGVAPAAQAEGRFDGLWVATSSGLYRLVDEQVERFDAVRSARTVAAIAGAGRAVVRDMNDAVLALRRDKDSWSTRALPAGESGAPADASAIVPTRDGSFLALADDALFVRRDAADGARARWLPLLVEPDADGKDKAKTQLIAPDATTGSVWIISDDELYRFDGGSKALRVARPAGLGVAIAAQVSSDGTLWLSDGERIARIGERKVVTYRDDVQPWMASNCTSCHSPSGPAPVSLENFDAVKDNVPRAIDLITRQEMPPSGGADATLLRLWRDGGYRK